MGVRPKAGARPQEKEAVVNGRVLIVEDEPAIRDMVAFSLRRAGLEPTTAADGAEAQELVAGQVPDLILLDWMLPGISGLDLARRLRADEHTSEVPIIMLTARGEETDRVKGLETGADDYVTKPFSTRELIARIKAVLRRSHPDSDADQRLTVAGLMLDPASHRVTAGERRIPLGPTEFRLLRHMMSHPDRVHTRGQLLDHVWGRNVYVEERTVDVHIRRLRKALAPFHYDYLIQTVRGAGYRLSARA